MGSRFPSHQLSNGLYVSGRPEQPKEKPVAISSMAMPYTGGDIRKSGELGKMFDIHVENSRTKMSGPIRASARTGSFGANIGSNRQKSNSGPLNKHGEPLKKSSGQLPVTPTGRQNSGPLAAVLPTTGLITSGPISSGPLNPGAAQRASGPLKCSNSVKLISTAMAHNQAVTNLSKEDDQNISQSMSLLSCWVRRAVKGFIGRYPDSELRTAQDGQYVKISGIVTCGNVPLESSFKKVPRCVYTSTSLYEFREWSSKPANSKHWGCNWGLRTLERHVVDFYISDFQSGLRALVKTGYGLKVTPYVDESMVVEVNQTNRDMSPDFLQWLAARNLSSDINRKMRLKEGYIKEGSTISVMGIVRRHQNVLMIVPPSGTVSTGCLWTSCMLPVNLEGVVLRCRDTSNVDAIPV